MARPVSSAYARPGLLQQPGPPAHLWRRCGAILRGRASGLSGLGRRASGQSSPWVQRHRPPAPPRPPAARAPRGAWVRPGVPPPRRGAGAPGGRRQRGKTRLPGASGAGGGAATSTRRLGRGPHRRLSDAGTVGCGMPIRLAHGGSQFVTTERRIASTGPGLRSRGVAVAATGPTCRGLAEGPPRYRAAADAAGNDVGESDLTARRTAPAHRARMQVVANRVELAQAAVAGGPAATGRASRRTRMYPPNVRGGPWMLAGEGGSAACGVQPAPAAAGTRKRPRPGRLHLGEGRRRLRPREVCDGHRTSRRAVG
jgi:hypothetical protein